MIGVGDAVTSPQEIPRDDYNFLPLNLQKDLQQGKDGFVLFVYN